MNTRAFTLALIIAALAMFMVYTYVEDQKSSIIKTYGTPVSVVVAKKDIQELELIDESKIAIITVPKTFAQPGSFNEIKDLENTVASVPIIKGEQITKTRVTFPGAKTGLARQVSVGKRAFALQVTEKEAVSRLLKPGDRVDIIAGFDISSGIKYMQKTKTVLQDVLVLSTGTSMTNSIPISGVETPKVIRVMNLNTYQPYNTITLELDPYQVQKMVYITTFTAYPYYLSLRNNNDKKMIPIRSTDVYDVLGEEDRAEAKQFFSEKYKNSSLGGRGGK
ncbi:MAG: Flp pilus assembly protein CpaB [Bdellovibrio sp. CG12_big_fil_rev_8_21_14_0_65_39_13]|nr:MAG: Flp pilus assembly protein CpaB [Bdellovibrio sp. CG22_combo_CG10-13_8_21_14_all_39_27]PIQ60893.1 MAG: Flp pilus assembly protein CpaB [Bdellovibrio sp. CG12_big_fil_rev_8_21_14_0_65_39_13]PIR36518.1 MAG: Flp pilus assembly protein CpaB [Bdellovibrio sp. CG11_big_fil_rev_8_21_14_0_20_39_38]